MLGAIKGDVEEHISLFRRLSRRWRPLARVTRERPALAIALGVEDEVRHEPAWIGVKRPRYVPKPELEKPNPKQPQITWNPWLWVK